MGKKGKMPDMNLPIWFDGQNINEALFCEEFLHERRIIFANGAFFTPDGRVTDDLPLRGEIYDKLKFCAVNNIPRKITNILEVLKLEAHVKSIVTAQGKMDLERKGKQSYQGWMFARLLAFSNGDLQALYDRSDGFYRRQLVLTAKEKPVDRADDPDLAEKMKAEAEGIFLWALKGLQRLVANNFKFTESDRIRENREAVKRDNNNIFDFMESEGYIRRKADASISSKDFYEIYRMWCEENSLAPLKARSFSDAMIANAGRFNLEHCNNITNSAGRRVWGFMGVEAIARPHINGFYGDSPCTYVPEDIPEEWRQVE